jgi:flagellar basal-body rod modification protein FlgD
MTATSFVVPPASSMAAAQATASTSRESKASVDYDTFLRLLVAEMKNQDPTNPMESRDYVAQLATFSQVEQTIQSNAKLDQILQSSALAQADSILGRTVTSADGMTSGTVQEVKLTANGLVAILPDKVEIPIVAGVTVK